MPIAGPEIGFDDVQTAIARATPDPGGTPTETEHYPGPVGESDELRLFPRGLVLCLGPTVDDLRRQVDMARRRGNTVLAVSPEPVALGAPCLVGRLPPALLRDLTGFAAVVSFAAPGERAAIRQALAAREGAILPLVSRPEDAWRLSVERHFCTDLTAAGGDVQLIASASA